MITTGTQIRAARALLKLHRPELAEAAGLHENAVAYWERHDCIPTKREPYAIGRIRQALERKGIVVFADPAPGVRFAGADRQSDNSN